MKTPTIKSYETPKIGKSYIYSVDRGLFLDGIIRVNNIMQKEYDGISYNLIIGKVWTIPNSYEQERDGKYFKLQSGEIFKDDYSVIATKLKPSEEQIYRDLYEVRQFLSLAKVFENSELFISFDIDLLNKIVEYIKEINKNYFINLEDPPKDKETLEAEELLSEIVINGGGKHRKKRKSRTRRKYKKSKKQKRKRNKKKTKRR
jgi:hypothetical protein